MFTSKTMRSLINFRIDYCACASKDEREREKVFEVLCIAWYRMVSLKTIMYAFVNFTSSLINIIWLTYERRKTKNVCLDILIWYSRNKWDIDDVGANIFINGERKWPTSWLTWNNIFNSLRRKFCFSSFEFIWLLFDWID